MKIDLGDAREQLASAMKQINWMRHRTRALPELLALRDLKETLH